MKELSLFDELHEMQKRFDRLFENVFENSLFHEPLLIGNKIKSLEKSNYRNPKVHINEDANQYLLQVELPGMNKKDIKLNITDDFVEINADTKQETKTKKSKYYSESCFYRKMSLPKNTNVAKAKAKYENGVLKLEIPKSKQVQTKPTQLKIE